ncbi:hypothetical protein ACJMK2_012560 [Sinanodonta woodiana]|uniref:Hexosyltransferase n=1 Tax=Sinanodonta woodiana TaxID=1069815 RepID=A0ABD3VBL3_SINWO
MVHSAVFHFDQREFLRRTWANKYLLRSHTMRILFLVGFKRNKTNGDIVQEDFIDDYHNLTHKGVMGFKWISENCKTAKYFIEIDDDVFVNIFNLIKTVLPVVEKHPRHIFCYTRVNNTVARNGRHAVNKHYFLGLLSHCTLYDVYLFGILPLVTGNVSLFHLPKSQCDILDAFAWDGKAMLSLRNYNRRQ